MAVENAHDEKVLKKEIKPHDQKVIQILELHFVQEKMVDNLTKLIVADAKVYNTN